MKDSELGKFVCVANCQEPKRVINSDGVWVKTGDMFSSAHRTCHEAQQRSNNA